MEKYVLYKNMLPFREFIKTQPDKKYTPKRTKLHHIFKIFSGKLAYAHEPPSMIYACTYN